MPMAIHTKAAAEVKPAMHRDAYFRLAIMTTLSFVSMYILMYAMVNSFGNVFNSVNQVYMAGLMTAPMVAIEIFLMEIMYPQKKVNLIIGIVAAVIGAMSFLMIRQQTLVTDRQFLRSMIPHHAGAILMCEHAALKSAEVKGLCKSIIENQNTEISRMKALLAK